MNRQNLNFFIVVGLLVSCMLFFACANETENISDTEEEREIVLDRQVPEHSRNLFAGGIEGGTSRGPTRESTLSSF